MPTNYWLKFGNSTVGFNGSGVQFTHVEQPGTLTVTLSGTGTGFSASKTFSVLVTFGSAITYSVNGTPIQAPASTYTASLKNGQSVVLGNIPPGTTYAVTENAVSTADYNAGYENGSVTNGSGTMAEGGSVTATANYVYYANTAVIGGTRYKTVTIGGKVWMAENLDYKYSGLSVGSSSSAASTSKLAWYYNNSEATYGRNGNKYGLLYNKAAAKYLNDNKATLIPGWHIPTRAEWQSGPLSSGASASYYKSTTGWSSGNGNNRTGFNAYPAGKRYTTNFRNVGSETYFFESDPSYQVYIYTGDSVSETSAESPYNAVSIRLVKD